MAQKHGVLTANDEKNLRIWERKVLRKIFGPICVYITNYLHFISMFLNF